MEDNAPIRRAFEDILANPQAYDNRDVARATKEANNEAAAAASRGLTVQEYRQQESERIRSYNATIRGLEDKQRAMESATYETFRAKVNRNLKAMCQSEGRDPFVHEEFKPVYDAITRYFWGEPSDLLFSRKHLMLYGCYGCGKSTLIKAINRSLRDIRGREGAWHYIHLPTLVNKAIAEKSVSPFNELFSCGKNLILDEFGDDTERQRIYGDYIDSIRNLVLDKYDKWITHSHRDDFQRICFTTNLFPDVDSFFTKRRPEDVDGTIQAFYGVKVSDRMREMCNMVRFPNINHRTRNIKNILI